MLGLLWMDDSDVAVGRKVEDAARRYQLRFGKAATLCYANEADVPDATLVKGVRVEPRRDILRHHFLVGRDEATDEPEGALKEKAA